MRVTQRNAHEKFHQLHLSMEHCPKLKIYLLADDEHKYNTIGVSY